MRDHAEEINSFVIKRNSYFDQFLSGAYDLASATLSSIEREFGYSYWTISARISLSQKRTGAAAAKSFINDVVGEHSVDAFTAYISYLMSYSLEDGVSPNDIRRELAGQDGNDAAGSYADYIRLHVTPFDAHLIASPAGCIWLEESGTLIDRYETFINMAQLLAARDDSGDSLKESMILLQDIRDISVHNLRFILSIDFQIPEIDCAFLNAADAYTTAKYPEALAILQHEISAGADRAWLFELAARCQAEIQSKSEPIGESLVAEIVAAIKAFLDISELPLQNRRSLERLGFMARKSSSAAAIAALLERDLEPSVAPTSGVAERIWYLKGPLAQPQGFKIAEDIAEGSMQRIMSSLPSAIDSITCRLLSTVTRPSNTSLATIRQLQLPDRRSAFYEAYALFNLGRFEDAANVVEALQRDSMSKFKPRELSFQYALLRRIGRIDRVLDAFAEAYLSNPMSVALYPLHELVDWASANARVDGSALARSILLHAYASRIDAKRDGDLSDAFEDVLDHYQVSLPSELVGCRIDGNRLRYFLRHIATIDRLEDTTRRETFDEYEAERIGVLQWLVENDGLNRGAYTQEIAAITKDQEVARLSAQAERSKIYVHEEGIRRTFDSEIRPLFDRYRQLLSDPTIEKQLEQIEQRLRRILKDSESTLRNILIPSTERDSIYEQLLQRAYDLLGLDPIHGLKTYLSTRVLHGVLEGELRASFSNEDLLVATDSPNKIADIRSVWGHHISLGSGTDSDSVYSFIEKFSSTIVRLIAELKDKKIRIYSRDFPQGLLKIGLDHVEFDRLKNTLTPTVEYSEFIDRLIAAFWESAEASLRDVRQEIVTRFRRRVNSAFDSLEKSIAQYGDRGSISALSDAIARSRPAFSFSVERVASWFMRSGVLPNEPFEISRAIDVATLIANNCYPRHPLSPVTTAPIPQRLEGRSLNSVVDLLTNCLQNVAEHAGFIDRASDVCINILETGDGDLEIQISNSLGVSVDAAAVISEMRALSQERDEISTNSVATEGKTGIRKMKRILRHDLGSIERLDVGLNDQNEVWVRFKIPRGCIHEVSYH